MNLCSEDALVIWESPGSRVAGTMELDLSFWATHVLPLYRGTPVRIVSIALGFDDEGFLAEVKMPAAPKGISELIDKEVLQDVWKKFQTSAQTDPEVLELQQWDFRISE